MYLFFVSSLKKCYNYSCGTNPICCCVGVLKVVHQLPEPAATQHEPHGQQALLL